MSSEPMSWENRTSRVDFSAPRTAGAFSARRGWTFAQIVLGGLLVTYLLGWAQDFERVHQLRAESPPPSKVVISKYEAWQRIYQPHAR